MGNRPGKRKPEVERAGARPKKPTQMALMRKRGRASPPFIPGGGLRYAKPHQPMPPFAPLPAAQGAALRRSNFLDPELGAPVQIERTGLLALGMRGGEVRLHVQLVIATAARGMYFAVWSRPPTPSPHHQPRLDYAFACALSPS